MNKILLLLPLILLTPTLVHALTPYQSGYEHGAKDAKTTYGLSNFMTQGGLDLTRKAILMVIVRTHLRDREVTQTRARLNAT